MTEENKVSQENTEKEKKKREYQPHSHLLFLADRYLSDLECFREMFSSVIPLLREQETTRKEYLDSFLAKAKDGKEEKNSENKKGEISFKVTHSDINKVLSNILKLNRAEILFRQQSIVSLISTFDEFLGGILKIVLRLHPEWLKSSEKTITYRELVDLGSIEEAISGLIDREVDILLRESHEKQIEFIDEKLKIGINKAFSRLPQFLEVAERRNLLVHTGGCVSSQYLERCTSFKLKSDSNQSVGDRLEIDDEYFNNAFSLCFELGLRISQASYRRLFKDQLDKADKALNNLTIKFLNSGDYNLAEVVCDFDLAIPEKLRSVDTEYIYFAKINQAIAKKFSGKPFEEGLEGVHWQVFHPKYALALHVLRDQFDDAAKIMRSSEIKDNIGKIGFRSWPLFKEFRNTLQFKQSYLEIFSEEYIPDPQKDMEDVAVAEQYLAQKDDISC